MLPRSVCLLAAAVLFAFAPGAAHGEEPVGSSVDHAAAWHALAVPGTWDEQTAGALDNFDGVAWYRCLVTMPGGWEKQPLSLRVENVDDAFEAYWNGTKLGGSGAFPPDYQPGTADAAELPIPADAITTGNNLVAIRVYDHENRGGFKGAAPVLVNGENGINLNGLWEYRTGDDPAWAAGPIAVTSTGIYWRTQTKDTAIELARAAKASLSPQAALERFAVPDDLEIKLLLGEPDIAQPLFLNWDERGRLWVMEYRQYPYPAGLTIVSKDEFWRSVYDKLPDPPPHGVKGADRITIHEDTDGDGTLDAHKVFVDGLSIATSFTKGRGGVWVLNPPYLLFYADANNDDVPDGDPVVHLQGFGMEDTHSVTNSLRFGPDGWLYASQGSTVSGNIFRPGVDKPEQAVHSMGQLIWRYHPEQRRYEIFAEGGGNSFGVEIDSKGRIYSGHNGGDTRGFHFVQGGYYQKGFGKHGPLSNPYSFGYFPQMKHHSVPRFTHNFIIYEGGVSGDDFEGPATWACLPEQYAGKLFGVEPLQGRVVQSEIFADTSTFATKDIDRPIATDDVWFRPVEIKAGPDGGIYIADLYEPQISHREHFSGQIDKTNGRVYRLQARGSEPQRPVDIGALDSAELVDILRGPNKQQRQTALRVLGDRRDESVIPHLRLLVMLENGQTVLECLWALNLCGGLTEEVASQTLQHSDPFVRGWTVRLMCDDFEVSPRLANQLALLAASEPYVEVRSQLACSARRLPAEQGLPIVRQLLARSEDTSDMHIPLLLWWAIETNAGKQRAAVLAMFEEPAVWGLPIVKEHILARLMRRLAAGGSRQELLGAARLLELAPNQDASAALMKGFEEAFQGRSLAALPDELVTAIDASGAGSPLLKVRQRDPEAVAAAISALRDDGEDVNQRIAFAQVLGEVDVPDSVTPLLEVVSGDAPDALRVAAVTALMLYADERIAEGVIAAWSRLSSEVRGPALSLLASRAGWSRRLAAAVAAEQVALSDIPEDIVRLMTVHRDDVLSSQIAQLWPQLQGATTAEMQALVEQTTAALHAGGGDPYRGKTLYKQSCGKCHLMYGDGGRIGPDLTSYQRKDQARVLLNVVNPSAEIREGFESYTALTVDGRVLNGFLFDQDDKIVVLRNAEGQNVTIPWDELEELAPQKKSLMPEGLLRDLDEQQIRDLFAFLQTSQPLNN